MDHRQNYIKPFGLFLPGWLLRCPDLSAGAKIVYIRLASLSNENGEAVCDLSRLANECGFKSAHWALYEAVGELERFGLIAASAGRESYVFFKHEIMGGTP